ncbi:MAG: DUF5681 domain-containing protein [Sphingobium sp.]
MTKRMTRKRGRPPGALNTSTIYRQFARQKVSITENGVRRKIPMGKALLRLLRHLALEGDIAAQKLVEKIRHTLNPESDSDRHQGVLLAPEMLSPAEWIRRAEIENRYKAEPDYTEDQYEPPLTDAVDKPVEQSRRKRLAGEVEPDPEPRVRHKRLVR